MCTYLYIYLYLYLYLYIYLSLSLSLSIAIHLYLYLYLYQHRLTGSYTSLPGGSESGFLTILCTTWRVVALVSGKDALCLDEGRNGGHGE